MRSAVVKHVAAQYRANNINMLLYRVKACSKERDLQKGKRIHADAIAEGIQSHIFVASTLIDMYAKCGSMIDARMVFDGMQRRDVVCWNCLIKGYARCGKDELALELYAKMKLERCEPDERTFAAALKSCINLAAKEVPQKVDGKLVKLACLQRGMEIQEQASRRGYDKEMYVASALVKLYAKCGNMPEARKAFDMMSYRDAISWNALLMGYVENGEGESAIKLFRRIIKKGYADAQSYVAVLMAYESIAANEGALTLQNIKTINFQASKSGYDSDISLRKKLLDLYVKCGSMVDARRVFENMRRPDESSWKCMIMGYSESGDITKARKLLSDLQKKAKVQTSSHWEDLKQL